MAVEEPDAVIVGAGILGCALAVTLAKQGRSIVLIERDMCEPDRIVGELLQPGGVKALTELGLRHCLDGIDAIPEYGYQVIYKDEKVLIPYVGKDEVSRLGSSFHHGRFVNNLRSAVKQQTGVTIIEGTVKSLVRNEASGQVLGVQYIRKGEELREYCFAPLTFVADGCFSNFRKELVKKPVQVRSNFVGLILKNAKLPAPNHGHVVLGNNAPVLIYQIGQGETRILVDVPGKLPSVATGELHKYLRERVLPDLPSSLQEPFSEAVETGRLKSMPNSFLPPSINKTEGIVLLGDAMNMRHPLTGGGMTVAFNDVVLLSKLLSPKFVPSFKDTRLVLSQMNAFHWKRKSLSSVINILAQALYSLFAANDEMLRALQEGCFRYFQLGGRCIEDPVGLLSGIYPSPLLLAFHFYAVALYSIFLLFRKTDVSNYPQTIIKGFEVLVKATFTVTGKFHHRSKFRRGLIMFNLKEGFFRELSWQAKVYELVN